jgi:hypothetical protein
MLLREREREREREYVFVCVRVIYQKGGEGV